MSEEQMELAYQEYAESAAQDAWEQQFEINEGDLG